MQRDGFACKWCNSRDKTLNVHHLVYSKNPWETKTADLVTLCHECHKKVSDSQKVIQDKIKSLQGGQMFSRISCIQNLATLLDSIDDHGFMLVSHFIENYQKLKEEKVGDFLNSGKNYNKNHG